MKLLSVFFALLFLPSAAFAIDYVSTGAGGDWSDDANWTPTGVPGDGDTATIASGSPITVDGAQVIGNSPAEGNTVLTVNTGGILTFDASASLDLRGDALLKGTADIVMGAGSILEFNSSLASSPSTTNYQLMIGDGHNSTPNLEINGTGGSKVTIRSNAGGGNGWINDGTGPWLQAGLIDAEHVNFVRIGDATNPAIRTSPTSATTFSLTDASFDAASGQIAGTYNLGADATYRLLRVNHAGTANAVTLRVNTSTTPLASGTREIVDSYFQKQVEFFTALDITVTGTVFNEAFVTTAGAFDTFSGNFIRLIPGGAEPVVQGIISDNYIFADSTSFTNPHLLQVNLTSTIEGNVFDSNTTDNQGDCIIIGVPGSAQVFTIENNIVLKNGGTDSVGTLFSALGNSNVTIAANHNTYYTGSQGAAVGETYAGHAGLLSSFKSNIAWDDVGSRGLKLYDSGTNNSVSNLVASASADYNSGYNLQAGSNLKGYNNLEFSSGSPGANDIDGNPTFLDATRNLKTFDGSVGGLNTYANAITELRKQGLSTFDSDYAPSAIVAWVKDGYQVGNAALENAGHDGVTIGAMPYVSVNTPTPTFTPTQTFTPTVTNTPTATPTYNPAATVPYKTEWKNQWVEWSARMYDYMLSQNGWVLPSDTGSQNQQVAHYYDATHHILVMPFIVGDTSTIATRIPVFRRAYRDSYVIPNNGAVNGFTNFTGGLREDWEVNGNATSKTAVGLMATNGVWVNSPIGDTADPNGETTSGGARENAYRIMTELDARSMGVGTRTDGELDDWLDQALDHLDIWTVAETSSYVRPFMVAIVSKALIQAFEEYPTYPNAGDIEAAIAAAYDYIWEEAWVPYSAGNANSRAFQYTDRETGNVDPPDLQGQPDLNGLILPPMGWLYKETLDVKWRQRGDEVFLGTLTEYDIFGFWVRGPYFGPKSTSSQGKKQLNQTYQWAYKYIEWAEEPAVGTPTPVPSNTPTNTPINTPTPTVTPTITPTPIPVPRLDGGQMLLGVG